MNRKVKSEVEVITPQTAAEYLSHNVQFNRHIRREYVETLARDMANGAFRCTHQGIAFDDEGNLIDGQHRLSAIMLANVPVEMMVTRGLDKEMVHSIDKGAQRSLHDTMTIACTGNDEKSKALRDRNVLNSIAALARLNAYWVRGISARDATTLFDLYEEPCLALHRICQKGSGRKGGAIGAALLAALIHGVPEETVAKFYQVFLSADISGCEQYNVQIVLSWRHYLDGLKARHMKVAETEAYKVAQFVIWNFANNTRATKVTKVRSEKFSVRDEVGSVLKRRTV